MSKPVLVGRSYSDFFECAVGLKQGEVISPLLFSLFIEDLELFLQEDQNCGLRLDDITFLLMLFVDDMVILGKEKIQAGLFCGFKDTGLEIFIFKYYYNSKT